MSDIIQLSINAEIMIGGALPSSPIEHADILIKALQHCILSSEEKEKIPAIIESAIQATIPPFREQAEHKLKQIFEIESKPKKDFRDASPVSSPQEQNIQKDGWIYYRGQNVLGYKDFTIKNQCPHKNRIVDMLEAPEKELSAEDKAELKEAMIWLVQSTFKGQPKEVIKVAFRIFPEDLTEEALTARPKSPSQGSTPTRKSGALFAPQFL